jgi:hypothetical protein
MNGALIEPECLEDSDGSSRLRTGAGQKKGPASPGLSRMGPPIRIELMTYSLRVNRSTD